MACSSASLFRLLVLHSSHPLLVRCFHPCRFLRLTQRSQHSLQAFAGVEDQLVIRYQDVSASCQRALVQDSHFLGLASRMLKACEIMQHINRLKIRLFHLLLSNAQRPLKKRFSQSLSPLLGREESQSMQRISHAGMLRS